MSGSVSLLNKDTSTLGSITELPVGTTAPQTLYWQGGTHDNDPTYASNWDKNVAPQMAANQTLAATHGTINLNGGNLAANQLVVSTPDDQYLTVNLKDHGSLDLSYPDTSIPNVKVNLSGGGEATTNVFSGPTGDSDTYISIDASKLDLQANIWFGKLSTHGNGTTYLQGSSNLHGTDVVLDTKLEGYGSVDLYSAANSAGHIEFKDNVPAGLSVAVHDHVGSPYANGVLLDSWSTTPGGAITLQDAFAEIAKEATSYTNVNGEIDLYSNGVKFDALNISAYAGSDPLKVGVAGGHTYVYNASASAIPVGGSSPGGSSAYLFASQNPITALPVQS